MAWLALLATTAPAWGCAAAMLEADCCPDRTSAPCPNDETDSATHDAVEACCAAAPGQSAAAPQTAMRVWQDERPDSHSSDALIFLAAAVAEARAAALPVPSFDFVAASVRDAASTYLRTGRLRL